MEPQPGASSNTYGQRFGRAHPDVGSAPPPAPNPTRESPAAPAAPPPVPAPAAAAGRSGQGPPIAIERDWGLQSILAGVLYFLALATGGLGVLGGLYTLSQAAIRGLTGDDWLKVCMWMIGGLGLAGLLAGCAGLLSMVGRQRRHLEGVVDSLLRLGNRVEQLATQPPAAATAAGDAAQAALAAQVLQASQPLLDRLDALGEAIDGIALDCLLDEPGRVQKRQQILLLLRDATIERVRREMADGQWDRAAAAIERFRTNYPADTEQSARLLEDLNRRRDQAEAEDVATARRQCDELMSVSAWDRAAQVAMGLVQKHPDSTPAKALVARVDRERKIAQEQQRQALYGQIQRHTSRREWKEAVAVAHRLIAQFPNSIESEAVKAQMETLTTNAEIQHRQGMESSIKDLVKRRRYEEAVALADELIKTYPNSPQAGVLRGSVEQLREKAAEESEDARRRRVQW